MVIDVPRYMRIDRAADGVTLAHLKVVESMAQRANPFAPHSALKYGRLVLDIRAGYNAQAWKDMRGVFAGEREPLTDAVERHFRSGEIRIVEHVHKPDSQHLLDEHQLGFDLGTVIFDWDQERFTHFGVLLPRRLTIRGDIYSVPMLAEPEPETAQAAPSFEEQLKELREQLEELKRRYETNVHPHVGSRRSQG